jgi:hypothetical protein
MSDQPALFDASQVVAQECAACGATRQPNEERAPACTADRDPDHYPRRPAACLNRYRPEHAEIPY